VSNARGFCQVPCQIYIAYHRRWMSDTLRRACGQLLTLGFDGPSAPPELLARIGRSEVGGVMLFRPNIEAPRQVAALVRSLRAAGPVDSPLVVSVDQEGGLVQRLRHPLTEWPPMLAVGDAGNPQRTLAVGRALGAELAALGIGWDLAPVLDVHTNPANPVIGNRAFGRTPEAVITHALAFWRGLRSSGVLGCGKHFPGHGDTHTDSHHDLPVVAHDQARLAAVELLPFAAAARAGLEALMTAHVMYPALDPALPATLSRPILTDLLRGELGFAGLLVSDDLGMAAVAARWPIDELVVTGLLAGLDCFVLREPAARQIAAWEALVRGAETRPEVHARVLESAARVAAFKALARVGPPVSDEALAEVLAPPAHQALAASFRTTGGNSAAGSPVTVN
jgi:beta-N-acetylhexosaminidase